NNAVVVAVGDFDAAQFGAEIAKAFGSIPAGEPPPPVRAIEPAQQGERRVVLRREAQLPFIALAYHAPNLRSNDAAALEVLESVLSGGRSARLHQELVYGKRLAREVGADYEYTSHDPGLFAIFAQPLPGKSIADLEKNLLSEVKKIQEHAPSEREVIKAKNHIEAAFVFGQDSGFYQALSLGQYEIAGDWHDVDRYLPAIRAVTPEDVHRVAVTYLKADNRTVGILDALPPQPGKRLPPPAPPAGMVR
ncbi:MAG: insulinase family protein, partial [Deltaproteobacteria bacterium]|nr:insulinase family protein [Deltaproteobacteria bacterium]